MAQVARQHCQNACLSEEALEEGSGQHVPGNGVSDGREDPVELSQGSFAVCLLARDAVNQLLGQPLLPHETAGAEPAQGHLPNRTHPQIVAAAKSV